MRRLSPEKGGQRLGFEVVREKRERNGEDEGDVVCLCVVYPQRRFL